MNGRKHSPPGLNRSPNNGMQQADGGESIPEAHFRPKSYAVVVLRWGRRWVPGFAVVLLVACGQDSAQRPTVPSDGPVHVTNEEGGTWTDGDSWFLEEDLILGGEDGQEFGNISAITTDSSGRIYILDSMVQEIHVFTADGEPSHVIGGRGSGPGEFTMVGVLNIGPGDTLWASDDGAMRYSLFTPEGEFYDSWRRTIVGSSPGPSRLLADGGYLDWVPHSPDGRMSALVLHLPVVIHDRGQRADTFPAIRNELEMLPSGRMPQLYFWEELVTAGDESGDVWFAYSREYQIIRRTLAGDTTLVFGLPAEASPVDEEDRALVMRNAEEGRSSIFREAAEALPETRPMIGHLALTDDGHVYVFADVANAVGGGVVDVFSADGQYLGRMQLPRAYRKAARGSFPVIHVSEDRIFMATEDDIGTPIVARFRVMR